MRIVFGVAMVASNLVHRLRRMASGEGCVYFCHHVRCPPAWMRLPRSVDAAAASTYCPHRSRQEEAMTAPPPHPPSRDLDLGQGFRFFFEDPDWVKKILIGGVFMLLSTFIVGAVFVAGYGVHLLRRVVRGEPRPLPEWEELGRFFGDGLRAL